MSRTWDPASQELAEHFLQDELKTWTADRYMDRVRSLSRSIQQAVEDWFADDYESAQLSKLTRSEKEQGLADRGTDTREEYEEKR